MKSRKIVTYDEISFHFKRRIVLKYRMDKTLIDIEINEDSFKAIEIWYWGVNYALIVDDRILEIIEWDSHPEDDFEEEIDIGRMSPDEFPEDTDNLFYS